MCRSGSVLLGVLLVLGVCCLAAEATSLCDAVTCLGANRTPCNRQKQRCPPCLAFGRVPDEFTCVEFTANTTTCPQSTRMCDAEAGASLLEGRTNRTANTTATAATASPPTSAREAENATSGKSGTQTLVANKPVESSPPSNRLAASSESASPSPTVTTPTTTSESTSSSGSKSDLSTILMVFAIIIGVLLLLIAVILVRRQCEKKQVKNQVVAVAQVPVDYTDNSEGCKSPHSFMYDSYSSSVDTIPMARNTMPRGAPPPRLGPYVDGRKQAQPLNAPLRQQSKPKRQPSQRPARRPPLTPTIELPPSPATARSDSTEDFQTMLSVRSDWVEGIDSDATTREKPAFLKSSSSTIPILSHPVRTESADSHDEIDIYPDTNDSYLDTGSFRSDMSEGRRMFSPVSSRGQTLSPVSSRRQDSFFGVDL